MADLSGPYEQAEDAANAASDSIAATFGQKAYAEVYVMDEFEIYEAIEESWRDQDGGAYWENFGE